MSPDVTQTTPIALLHSWAKCPITFMGQMSSLQLYPCFNVPKFMNGTNTNLHDTLLHSWAKCPITFMSQMSSVTSWHPDNIRHQMFICAIPHCFCNPNPWMVKLEICICDVTNHICLRHTILRYFLWDFMSLISGVICIQTQKSSRSIQM